MSDPRSIGPVRIALVGATGLVGRRVIELASAGDEVRIVGIARREVPLPPGARMEMFVAEPAKWGEVLDAVRPRALICALGTTWKKAGRDEAAQLLLSRLNGYKGPPRARRSTSSRTWRRTTGSTRTTSPTGFGG